MILRWSMRHWRALAMLAGTLAMLAGGMFLYGLREAHQMPVVRRTTLVLPGLDPQAPPITLALLSDIHFGNAGMRRARLDAIVDQVDRAQPDVIVIVGDFVNAKKGRYSPLDTRSLTAALSRLHAPLGVYATLGNHEFFYYPGRVVAVLKAAGIEVLDNSAVQVGPLTLVGVSDRVTRHDDVGKAIAATRGLYGPQILVTHAPTNLAWLPPRFTTVLAGHTHCGQVVLPGLGSVMRLTPLLKGKYYIWPRYTCGIVHDGARTTVITGGLGPGGVPIRIGAPPDWWLITLRGKAISAPKDPGSPPGPNR